MEEKKKKELDERFMFFVYRNKKENTEEFYSEVLPSSFSIYL